MKYCKLASLIISYQFLQKSWQRIEEFYLVTKILGLDNISEKYFKFNVGLLCLAPIKVISILIRL